ncbi:MAG TPA: hypothetical protein VGJ19_09290 [Streptosporangiaceae bacterium]|jgi:hypothetical protein
MSRLTPIDEAAPRLPLLVRPFQAGMIGWIVVFGATVVVLAGGAITSQMSLAASVPVLVIPVVLAFGFGMVQWWQVRSAGADPTSWWHLGAIPVAVLIWYLWPNVPNALSEADGSSAPSVCDNLPTDSAAACLHRAAPAVDAHNLAWWLALALIVVAALLARRSRIAVWSSIPAAFAGCLLASSFLEQLVRHYQVVK